jgi:uncharacterized protein with FMN-binding domain
MRSLTDSKTTVAVLAGLTLVGALAGCSPTTTAETPTDDSTTESTDETTAEPTETDSSEATYTDGTYEATGEYQSPNGTESLDVTITLENDVITAVEVVGAGGSPNTERFQGEFAGGIAAIVVGKDIDEISVSKVAGSSLASGGFNAAVEQIKADAAS